MNAIQMINTKIYARLVNGSGTALYSNRVYSPVAPVKAEFPFIVFNPVFVFSDNETHERTFRCEYRIDAWSKMMAQANTIIDFVDGDFLNKPLIFDQYTCMSMRIGDFFTDTENYGGEQLYRASLCIKFEITQK